MKKELVSEALNGLDEAYIKEAEEASARRPRYLLWAGAAAACLALVLALGLIIKKGGARPVQTVQLPRITISTENTGSFGRFGVSTFDIPKDRLPDAAAMNVYNAVRLEMDARDAEAVAILLGAEATETSINEETGEIRVTADGVRVRISDNRITAFHDIESEPAKEMLLPEAEYVRIAREFLEKSGLPVEKFLSCEPVFEINSYTVEDFERLFADEEEDIRYLSVKYIYEAIDGVDFIGQRSFISVKMNNDGEISEVNGMLFDFTDPVEYPLMSAEEVMGLYASEPEKALIMTDCPEEGGVCTEVSIKYYLVSEYREGVDYYESYIRSWLIPVYKFHGEYEQGMLGDLVLKSGFSTTTRAISQEYLEIKRPEMIFG